MKKTLLLLLTVGVTSSAAFAQTDPATETKKEKRQHEIACVAGTVSGALLGAAFGGIFGNGVGKTIMAVAGGSGGSLLGHKLACKDKS